MVYQSALHIFEITTKGPYIIPRKHFYTQTIKANTAKQSKDFPALASLMTFRIFPKETVIYYASVTQDFHSVLDPPTVGAVKWKMKERKKKRHCVYMIMLKMMCPDGDGFDAGWLSFQHRFCPWFHGLMGPAADSVCYQQHTADVRLANCPVGGYHQKSQHCPCLVNLIQIVLQEVKCLWTRMSLQEMEGLVHAGPSEMCPLPTLCFYLSVP